MFTEISLHKHLLTEITELATLSDKSINDVLLQKLIIPNLVTNTQFSWKEIFFTILLNIHYWTTPSKIGSLHTIF